MRRRPWVSVEIEPGSSVAWISGFRAKELIESCGGRPLWSASRRAWNTSSAVGRDVLAAAEANGYAVAFTGGDRNEC